MSFLKKFWKNKEGVSAVETAILFPLLITLLTAVYDLGQGVVISQKVNTAAQVMGDLLTRYETVDEALITDIINAGELSLDPYPTAELAYDIASVQFDEDDDPVVLWRRSFGMLEEQAPINATIGLGTEGQGVIVVSVTYDYVPFFNNFIIDEFSMYERAFLRGRKSITVPCTDCS
ncbi:MAG: TadE/TadG family type IV pilus assembly protein [Pseudomonadota bacterium]